MSPCELENEKYGNFFSASKDCILTYKIKYIHQMKQYNISIQLIFNRFVEPNLKFIKYIVIVQRNIRRTSYVSYSSCTVYGRIKKNPKFQFAQRYYRIVKLTSYSIIKIIRQSLWKYLPQSLCGCASVKNISRSFTKTMFYGVWVLILRQNSHQSLFCY